MIENLIFPFYHYHFTTNFTLIQIKSDHIGGKAKESNLNLSKFTINQKLNAL